MSVVSSHRSHGIRLIRSILKTRGMKWRRMGFLYGNENERKEALIYSSSSAVIFDELLELSAEARNDDDVLVYCV